MSVMLDYAFLLMLEKIFKQYEDDAQQILTEEAGVAHAKGDVAAHAVIGMKIDFNIVNKEAIAYAQKYGDTLRQTGGSYIDGKIVPWFADSNVEQRKAVVEIIERGIREGKAPGVKENVKGGYGKNTIANELEEYFNVRRSQASTIARTETRRIVNQSTIERYRSTGVVDRVRVLDGENNGCPHCREVNGEIWTLDYAQSHELEHPNCERVFSPVTKGSVGGRTPEQ